MNFSKQHLLLGAILAVALTTGTIFAATTGTGSLGITSGSSLSEGGLIEVTDLSGTFTLFQGKAQKEAGVELFRADLASSTVRNQVQFFVALQNPGDIGQVLNNPNSWIEVSLAYEVNSGEDFTLSTGEKVKVASLRVEADNHITRENANVLLLPEMGGDAIDTDTYWVLGSINVPGGAPPGQQNQLASLQFHVAAQ